MSRHKTYAPELVITHKPTVEKRRLLSHIEEIHERLFVCRSSLCVIAKESALDDHITRALTEVGKLRLAITEL